MEGSEFEDLPNRWRGSGGEGAMNCVHVAPNKSLERTVNHRGRTVRAFAVGARAGADERRHAAVQRNR